MRIGTAAIAFIALDIAATGYFTPPAPPRAGLPASPRIVTAETTHTVLDSVFTDAQATRGEALYRSTCSSCHAPELTGNEDALPLTGNSFFSNWNGQTMADLFSKIRNSMPPDDPGALGTQETADVLAHILRFNKFPAGNVELSPDVESLKGIVIQSPKP
jgi:quinoprotein glucose dehydrogenase